MTTNALLLFGLAWFLVGANTHASIQRRLYRTRSRLARRIAPNRTQARHYAPPSRPLPGSRPPTNQAPSRPHKRSR
jgi:hypothetical protein